MPNPQAPPSQVTIAPALVARFATMIIDLSHPDGGFTVDPATGNTADCGYAVSVHREHERVLRRPVTADDLTSYLDSVGEALALPGRVFGGWHDPDTGCIHLDVSAVVATLAAALVLGQQHRQRAVFDLAAGKSITVDSHAIPLSAPRAPAPRVPQHSSARPVSPRPAPRPSQTGGDRPNPAPHNRLSRKDRTRHA